MTSNKSWQIVRPSTALGEVRVSRRSSRFEQIKRSSESSLLRKAADKDDCADQVVTMCRTNTMTGQTIVIDSGRYFH